MLLFGVSIFLAFLSVANKLLLLLNKKSGWTSGMVIGVVSGMYFFAIGLKILGVAELGFFFVMLYGYLVHTNPSKRGTLWINVIMSAISILLCSFLFVGYLTVVETISSLAFIWGGYALASKTRWAGWLLLVVAHVATSVASFNKGQAFFASMQIVSALVCLYGLLVEDLMSRKRLNSGSKFV